MVQVVVLDCGPSISNLWVYMICFMTKSTSKRICFKRLCCFYIHFLFWSFDARSVFPWISLRLCSLHIHMPAQRSVCREGCRRWGVANTSSQGFNHPPYFPVFLKHEGNRLVAEAAFHLSHPVNNRSFAKTKMRKKIQLSFSVTQSIQRFLDLFHTVSLVSALSPIVTCFTSCWQQQLLPPEWQSGFQQSNCIWCTYYLKVNLLYCIFKRLHV